MSILYDVITALCEQKGITGYRLCKDTRLQPSIMTDLRKGRKKTLTAATLSKIATYFGVPIEFLFAETPEGYLLWTKYQLAEAEKQYEQETDEDKRFEIATQIDALRESLADQKLAATLAGAKKENPALESEDGLSEAEKRIIELYRAANPAAQDAAMNLLRSLPRDPNSLGANGAK